MIRLRVLGAIDIRRDDGSAVSVVLRQPKRTALLTYLAASPDGLPRRRDVLVATFWPEADDRHARDSLSAALGFLRRSLGSEAFVRRGEEEIGCDPRHLGSDVGDFLRAIDEGREEDAVALYRGDLLPGLHVQDSPGFEEWLEGERSRLRRLAAGAALRLAERASAEGRASGAVTHALRAVDLAPDDEAIVRRLIELQLADGNRGSALRTYEQLAARLAAEYDARPAEATLALIAKVRGGAAPAPRRQPGNATPSASSEENTSPPRATAVSTRGRRDVRPIAAAILLVGALVVGLAARGWRDLIDAPGDEVPLVVVADFVASDTVLGVTAGAWLRSMLSRSTGVRTLEGQALADALRRMRRDPMLPLDASVARELARREGGEGVITGRITQSDSGFSLGIELVRADGRVIARPGAVAKSPADVLAALAAIGESVLDHIATGEMPRASDLRPVTTSSLEALIAYTEGDRLRYNALDVRAAVRYYERAIQLDSTFAMAYSQLGGAWNALGSAAPGQDTIVKLWRTAIRFADGLAPHEMLAIQDRMIFAGQGEQASKFEAAVKLYQDYLRLHPDDGSALQSLSWYLKHVGQWIESETPALRAIDIGYIAPGVYDELVLAQIAAGKHDDAARALRDWRDRHGPSQLWYRDAFRLASARRDYAAADSLTAEALRDRTWNVQPNRLPLIALLIRGRVREADSAYSHAARRFEASGQLGSLLRETSWFAVMRAGATGDTTTSLALLHEVLRRHPPATLSASNNAHTYKDAGRHLAVLGDTAGARIMLQSLQSNWYIYRLDYSIRGLIHHAAGRWDDAIRELRYVQFGSGHLPALGQAYEAVGATDSAVAAYELFLTQQDPDSPAWDAVYLADVLERLGAIHAARGQAALAEERFLLLERIWAEADAELKGRADRARERAARQGRAR